MGGGYGFGFSQRGQLADAAAPFSNDFTSTFDLVSISPQLFVFFLREESVGESVYVYCSTSSMSHGMGLGR